MKILCVSIFMCCFLSSIVYSQDIILDQPVRAGELTLFPSLRNENEYYYVSDKPRLASDSRGRPQFSFLRYVDNQSSSPGNPDINEGEGGGIIHAVIELNVTDQQINDAQQELRDYNSDGVIRGAAIYEGGTIALISTVSNPQSGFSRQVLGLGKAPILDGQKAAVSIFLTKLGAKVLWESFQTPTPDMSFSFEMNLKGYKSPTGAVIEANFEQIYEHESFSAAAISRQGSTILGGEINTVYEDLYRSGAIKVTSIDPDEDIQKAIDDAYSKLTRMMFEPAGLSQSNQGTPGLPGVRQQSMLDKAQSLLSEGREDAQEDFLLRAELSTEVERESNQEGSADENSQESSDQNSESQESRLRRSRHRGAESRPAPNRSYNIPRERYSYNPTQPTLPTTAIIASYSMRRIRQRGVFRIDLNKYSTDNIALRFDQNVGNINCPDCFTQINLDDPLYRQREIAAILDGYNSEDFQKYINFVSVSLKKKHQNGDFTNKEIRIDRTKFNEMGNYFKFTYGWKGDENRSKWNEYEYRTVWNFFGGVLIESPWLSADYNTIGLTPPYQRQVIDIEIDPEIAQEKGIRSAEVKVYYNIENNEMTRQVRLNPRADFISTQIEILIPTVQESQGYSYEYEIIWILNDGSTNRSERKTSSNLVIFADQF